MGPILAPRRRGVRPSIEGEKGKGEQLSTTTYSTHKRGMRGWLMAGAICAMVLAPVAAYASKGHGGMANGTGKLHLGGTLGFNAKSDLSGQLEYHSPDGSLNVHCDGYHGYFQKTTKKGYLDATFGSYTCTDPGGDNTYRVWVDAQDRGEGSNAPQDTMRIKVFDSNGTLLIYERGPIQNGNVQIHG
jgi:hypothetical protein